MFQSVRAVFFDWDEVIAKTDAVNEHIFSELFALRGFRFDHSLYLRHFAGRRLEEGIRSYLRAVKAPLLLLDELVRAKQKYDACYGELLTPYSDAQELIHRIRVRFPLAIVSGTRRVLLDTGLQKFGLGGFFPVLVTGEDYEKSKPNPDPYVVALKKMNARRGLFLEPHEVLAVEDSPNGVLAAKRAGMQCVAVMRSHRKSELSYADLVVHDLHFLRL